MLIANLIIYFIFTFEIILYIVLGVNIFSRPQISDNNSPISYEPPQPGYNSPGTTTTTTTTTTAAPIDITCVLRAGGPPCNSCPSGTTGGTIQSPNYPNDYETPADINNRRCVYVFTAASGKVKMVLKAGANIGYSIAGVLQEVFQFSEDPSGAIIDTSPTTFPTTADLTFTTVSTGGKFSFEYDLNACPSPPCKWEMKYSAVA